MTVRVRGKNLEVTPALKDYVEKKVETITKQFKTVGEITAVIDNCVEKIERQIHKYKTRLMKRKYNNFRDAAVPPVSGDVEEASAAGEFKVARTKTYAMRPMNVQEAIMQMNMLNHDFFVFFNDETESMAVVYRRKAGDYGLINPELV